MPPRIKPKTQVAPSVMDKFKLSSSPTNKQKNIQKSLNTSEATSSTAKANKKSISIQDKLSSDWNRMNPIAKATTQLLDPTGTTSYPDVKKAWSDNKFNRSDILEPLGALPIIGKIPKVISKGLQLAKSVSSVTRAASVANKVNKVTDKVNKGSKLVNQETLGEAILSPLNQKLSPLAAKRKAVRDLAYAKTEDRKNKKAHAQRMHRKDPAGKGKDWDHKNQRWETPAQNRGNDGLGTKKESGKKYKTK